MMKDGKTLEEMLEGIPDEFNDWFRDIHTKLIEKYDIIICSGRTEDGKCDKEKWLKIHNVKYHALYMRKNKDMRSDFYC